MMLKSTLHAPVKSIARLYDRINGATGVVSNAVILGSSGPEVDGRLVLADLIRGPAQPPGLWAYCLP